MSMIFDLTKENMILKAKIRQKDNKIANYEILVDSLSDLVKVDTLEQKHLIDNLIKMVKEL